MDNAASKDRWPSSMLPSAITPSKRNPPRNTIPRVFRFLPNDRDCLKTLQFIEGLEDRYHALEKLTEIVKAMPTEELKRRPIRINIPKKLHYAIKKLKKKNNRPYAWIFLEAIHEYERLHSVSTVDVGDNNG